MSATDMILKATGGKIEKKGSIDARDLAKDLHDQIVGKTVIVTGVSSNGLGATAAAVIAQHSPKLLILASRSTSNIDEVAKMIKSDSASANVNIQPLELDLASLASVRAAAARVQELTPTADVLINNAGVMMLPTYRKSADGYEMHLATNHLGHFHFTSLLTPALLASTSGARVLNVTSNGARASGIRFDDWNFSDGKAYEPFLAYSQSKTANILFTTELAARAGSKGLRAFAVDPGLVATTQLGRDVPAEQMIAQGFFLPDGSPNPDLPFNTAVEAVASYIAAAFDPKLNGHSGAVIVTCQPDDTFPAHCTDPESARKLWALSEKLVQHGFKL